MRVIALTGGIGAGKSTALAHFAQRGAKVLESDRVAEALIAQTPQLRLKIAQRFGTEVLQSDGMIDKAVLAQRAFSSQEGAKALNSIVFPAVEEAIRRIVCKYHAMAPVGSDGLISEGVLIIEIPLLNEVPTLVGEFDEVVTISAPEIIRIDRALKRGMKEEDVRARVEAQTSDARREQIASSVVSNTLDQGLFIEHLDAWWDERNVSSDIKSAE